jgi:hypothetical protein
MLGPVYLPPVAALASNPRYVFTDFGPDLADPISDVSSAVCGLLVPCDAKIDIELILGKSLLYNFINSGWLHGSYSITPPDWKQLLDFSSSSVYTFIVSPTAAQFGIVQFADYSKLELSLSSNQSLIIST